jgi:hypothetical protein
MKNQRQQKGVFICPIFFPPKLAGELSTLHVRDRGEPSAWNHEDLDGWDHLDRHQGRDVEWAGPVRSADGAQLTINSHKTAEIARSLS